MAIFVDELTTYLVSQLGGSWVIGTNVFNDAVPQGVKPAIALWEDVGESGNLITDIFTPYIRLLVRADDMTEAKTNFQTAFTILNRFKDTSLTTYSVAYIESIGSGPRPVRDEPQDVILEGNFRVKYKAIET